MARNGYRRGRVRPRGACPLCGRNVALLGDGRVAMRHWAPDGTACAGHGERTEGLQVIPPDAPGACAVCSAQVKVMANGNPRPHKARRMRMGAFGPETYLAEECSGVLVAAEVGQVES